MLRALIEKEIKNNLLSLRFALASAAMAVIVFGGFTVRLNDHVQSVMDNQANAAGVRDELRDGQWYGLEWGGMFVERPVQALGVLVTGSERDPDTRVRVFSSSRPAIQPAGSLDRNPLTTLSSPVDLMFITGIVMSLLVMVLSYDALSGERESGTLKLVLSFPVPRSTFLLGKWLGGLITLFIPFVVCGLGLALWILLSGRIHFSGSDWAAFLLIGLASLLYIAWMFSAALLVSCWFRASATSMGVLLALWVVAVLVVPNVSPYLAAGFVPVESAQSVQFKSMKVAMETREKDLKNWLALREKYPDFRWASGEKIWKEYFGGYLDLSRRQRQAVRAIMDRREAGVEAQTALARALGRCSPFGSYAHIVTTLAWTGPEFSRHLWRALREYEDRLGGLTRRGLLDGVAFAPDRIPFFRYEPPPVSRRFMMAWLDWALLVAGTAVLFLAAYVSFVTREVIE